ncbi:ATP-binding protein [Streptomyces sp. NPDC014734]|uniref:ATP-binding protein n=1 Tax=Streptomyces sp. NPDC014734 TaxID=3364886 RepID=UPI0036F8392E
MTGVALTMDLVAVPRAVPEVRRLLRAWCRDEEALHLLICVSELLTNAIVHLGTGTPVTLRVIGTSSGHVRVELTDPEPGAWPVPRSAEDDEESGRGLSLVGALASRWGVDQGVRGKTIWCELPLPAGLDGGGAVEKPVAVGAGGAGAPA